MGQFPAVEVHVVGNTDQRGEETRNFVVSQRRADAVVNYLVARGRRPATADDAAGRRVEPAEHRGTTTADALNRRTDYVVFGLLD